MNLSNFIKNKRNEKGLSLREFAKMCELSHSYIEKLENGFDKRTGKPVIPTIDTLQKISKALNLELSNLLSITGYIEDNNKIQEQNDEYVTIIGDARAKGISPERLQKFIDFLSEDSKKK